MPETVSAIGVDKLAVKPGSVKSLLTNTEMLPSNEKLECRPETGRVCCRHNHPAITPPADRALPFGGLGVSVPGIFY